MRDKEKLLTLGVAGACFAFWFTWAFWLNGERTAAEIVGVIALMLIVASMVLIRRMP